MVMEKRTYNKFERAQRKVAQIKGFYKHVGLFIIFNAVLYLSNEKLAVALLGPGASDHPEIMSWVYWNAVIWGVILAVHALFVFGNVSFFVKKWEERQMAKIIQEEQEGKKHR